MPNQCYIPDVICFVYFHGKTLLSETRKQWILPQGGTGIQPVAYSVDLRTPAI
jgi:hypothetical protein